MGAVAVMGIEGEMIRIIVEHIELGLVVGGAPHAPIAFKTVDVELPELEAYLRTPSGYDRRRVIGAELLESREK